MQAYLDAENHWLRWVFFFIIIFVPQRGSSGLSVRIKEFRSSDSDISSFVFTVFPFVCIESLHLLWNIPSCLSLWWRISEGSQQIRAIITASSLRTGVYSCHISLNSLWGSARIDALWFHSDSIINIYFKLFFILVFFGTLRLAQKHAMSDFLLFFTRPRIFQTPSLLRPPTWQKSSASTDFPLQNTKTSSARLPVCGDWLLLQLIE